MEYSRLGHSGLQVSRLALGCMTFGEASRGSHPWTLDFAASEKIITRALDLGINFFDTANIYSLGSSEEIVGACLKKHARRDQVVIATKVYEKMTTSPLSGGLSRKEIFTQLDDSLRRLQTDYIDLYIIHRWDEHTPIEETMSALHDVVRAGKVRYIGASSMRTWQFVKAQYTATLNGWTRFISMQNHYNLINREEEREMLPYCMAEGVGVTPWSPLARGKLARKAESHRTRSDQVLHWLYESAKESDEKIISALDAIAEERNVSSAHIALSWLLAQPAVVSPVIGASSVAQLEDNVHCFDISLNQDELTRLEKDYVPHTVAELK